MGRDGSSPVVVGVVPVPLVGRAVLRGRLETTCLLIGGAAFPSFLLSGLRHPSTGAYRLLSGPDGVLQVGSCQ